MVKRQADMTPKLASMAESVIDGLAADDGGRLGKSLKSSLPGMTEPIMPSSGGGSGHESAGTGW